jgi:hypothetical protein
MATRVVSRGGQPAEVYSSDSKTPDPVEPPIIPHPIPTPIGTLRVDGTIEVDLAPSLGAAIVATAPNGVIVLRADHPIGADDHRVVEEVASRFDRTVMVEEDLGA